MASPLRSVLVENVMRARRFAALNRLKALNKRYASAQNLKSPNAQESKRFASSKKEAKTKYVFVLMMVANRK